MKFAGRDDQFVVVGTVKDLQLRPRTMTCGYLVLYKLSHSGDQLELVHRTEVEDLPAAITPFHGRLLVGVGRYLRIYDYGKKKLLRKCENKVSILDAFRVRRSRGEMYIGHGRLCVCVCVCVSVCLSVACHIHIPTLLHGPGCNLGEW